MRINAMIQYKNIGIWSLFLVLHGFFNVVSPATASDQFIKNKNGTITDTINGLMWVSKDNGFPLTGRMQWDIAKHLTRKGLWIGECPRCLRSLQAFGEKPERVSYGQDDNHDCVKLLGH